jgi:hypothetical protein
MLVRSAVCASSSEQCSPHRSCLASTSFVNRLNSTIAVSLPPFSPCGAHHVAIIGLQTPHTVKHGGQSGLQPRVQSEVGKREPAQLATLARLLLQ